MGASLSPILFLVLAPATRANSDENKLSESECRTLGFAPSLLCSSCAKLAEFIPTGDSLLGECQSCCTDDIADNGSYSHATLDVCK
jgi:hypothetical protein